MDEIRRWRMCDNGDMVEFDDGEYVLFKEFDEYWYSKTLKLSNEKSSLKRNLIIVRKENRDLVEENERLKYQLGTLKGDYDLIIENRDHYSSACTKLSSQNAELKEEKESLSIKCTILERGIEAIKEKDDSLSIKNKELLLGNRNLTGRLDIKENYIKKLSVELNKAQDTIKNDSSVNIGAGYAVAFNEETERRNDKLREENEKLLARNEELDRILNDTMKSKHELAKIIKQHERNLYKENLNVSINCDESLKKQRDEWSNVATKRCDALERRIDDTEEGLGECICESNKRIGDLESSFEFLEKDCEHVSTDIFDIHNKLNGIMIRLDQMDKTS
ncbi:MAG: hypothetical protein KAS32_17855 [Candidatus Peribacteraceae bacterium]|nr:hypothetical protein [Candidatus Peribacteraceae bacterium]